MGIIVCRPRVASLTQATVSDQGVNVVVSQNRNAVWRTRVPILFPSFLNLFRADREIWIGHIQVRGLVGWFNI